MKPKHYLSLALLSILAFTCIVSCSLQDDPVVNYNSADTKPDTGHGSPVDSLLANQRIKSVTFVSSDKAILVKFDSTALEAYRYQSDRWAFKYEKDNNYYAIGWDTPFHRLLSSDNLGDFFSPAFIQTQPIVFNGSDTAFAVSSDENAYRPFQLIFLEASMNLLRGNNFLNPHEPNPGREVSCSGITIRDAVHCVANAARDDCKPKVIRTGGTIDWTTNPDGSVTACCSFGCWE